MRQEQFDQDELDKLLNRLDEVSKAYDAGAENRRAHQRKSFREIIILVTSKRGDQEVSFIVNTRNISDGGVAFLHDEILEPGTPCEVRILQVCGDWLDFSGEITRCSKIVEGTYEVGMRFQEVIDIDELQFVQDVRVASVPFSDGRIHD